jgi:hypothetical protein
MEERGKKMMIKMMAVVAAVMAAAMWIPEMSVPGEGRKFGRRHVAIMRGY